MSEGDNVVISKETYKKLLANYRPQGEWIKNDLGTVICSECKRPRRDNRVNHINFCNSCGARMRPELQGKHFDSIIIDESAMKGADDDY